MHMVRGEIETGGGKKKRKKKEVVRGRGLGWRREEKSARERKEVVIVTESLYTCQTDLFKVSCFCGGKNRMYESWRGVSLRHNYQPACTRTGKLLD